MTATHALAVALVASQLLACSSNCWQGSNSDPAVFVSGTGSMDVTCADGTRRPSKLMSRILYFRSGDERSLVLSLDYRTEGVTPNMLLHIAFPTGLGDGSYPLEGENPRVILGDDSVESITRGTFAFQRTRDVPFADIQEPERGQFASSIEFTLEMEGILKNPGYQCAGPAPFTLPPVTIHLDNVATVAECPSSVEWTN
jgi:hypothetical protein